MSETVTALVLDPWLGLEDAPPTLRRPLLLWRKAMWFKANPRPAAYMRALLAEHWPQARLVDVRSEPHWAGALTGAERVVLLYPDAIGIGFGGIERRLLRLEPHGVITVLNGRRRVFELDRRVRRRLLLRRFLERSMLIECILGVGMLAATPFLVCLDLARGRR
jgi:hypothetical protein